jgi:hypothetical protein
MKRMMILAAGLAAVTMMAGCASSGSIPKVDQMYMAYLAQPRTFSPVRMIAAPGQSITITGIGELTTEAPLNPLSLRSADPSTAQATIASLERLLSIGIGAWALESIATKDAVRPEVVRQEVLVPVEGAAAAP